MRVAIELRDLHVIYPAVNYYCLENCSDWLKTEKKRNGCDMMREKSMFET